MRLNPNSKFPITYLIGDTTDTNIYYVQAVVRNTATGVTLSTIQLTRNSLNSRLFDGSFMTPPDPNGYGVFIDVITTVYDDSSYSTKNTSYPENQQTYQVMENWTRAVGGGGGGGGFDYQILKKVIREIIKEEVKIPEPTKVDLKPLCKMMDEVHGSVRGIKFPEIKFPEHTPTDLTPLSKGLESLRSEVRAIKKSEVDATAVLEELNRNKEEFKSILAEFTSGTAKNKQEYERISEKLKKTSDEGFKMFSVIAEMMKDKKHLYTLLDNMEAPKGEEPFDLSTIM